VPSKSSEKKQKLNAARHSKKKLHKEKLNERKQKKLNESGSPKKQWQK
jgi:hypothetical protein